MSDVRVRRHQETKRAIVAAALERFGARGFDDVTMEEIADAAGVSRRTVYRRFATKEDIVLELPRRWVEAWDAVADQRLGSDPSIEVAEACAMAVANYIDDHADEVLVAYAALASSPSLASSSLASESWLRRIDDLLRSEPAGRRLSDAERAVIAGAYLGAIDAMMLQWAAAGGAGSVADSTRMLLDRLRPVWT